MLAEVALEGQGRGWYRQGSVKKVLLFTMEGSADGEAALAFLQARGAAVDVRDVGRDPAELLSRVGRIGVPTVVIEDRAFVGFAVHRAEIETLLRE
jgi:glutaredoxin